MPTEDSFVVGSGFVQDDITLVPNRLRVVAGTKILHNSYTGWEQQPNARVLWTPNQDRTLWFAVSRAVRLPTRVEEGVRLNISARATATPPGVAVVRVQGSPGSGAEHATAYELGFRMQVIAPWFVDLAVYRNTYSRLNVNPGLNPTHRARIQAAFDLPHRLQWDIGASHTSRLRATNVPAYTQVDTRLAWRPRASVEFDLVAQHLLDAGHVEWIPVGGGALYESVEVPRSVVARVTWRR